MKIILAYLRVSTDNQKTDGLSIDAQEKMCLEEAKNLGHESIEIIKDEGKSAGSMNRPGLKRIMKLCEENKVEKIIMVSSDRLSRNMADHIVLRNFFKEHGVSLHYISQANIDTDNAMGVMMDNVFASFNEFQRLQTADKTKSTLLQKVKEGHFPGVAPLGYINVNNPKFRNGEISKRIIAPDPDTAPLVKEMFELYATGDYSVYNLAPLMAQKGLKSRRGMMLHPSKVYEALRNRLYIGELRWGGIFIEKAKHEPIIDKALFDRVQMVITAHNRGACRTRKYNFILRGFVFCAICGRRFTAEWHAKPSGLKFSYYHCSCGKCDNPYVSVDDLEKLVESKFEEIQFSPEYTNSIIEEAKTFLAGERAKFEYKKRILSNQKTALEQKRSKAENKLFDGVISDADFTRIRSEIKIDLDGIQSEMEKLTEQEEAKVDVAQEILLFSRDVAGAYRKAAPFLKRHYLDMFWQRFEAKDKLITESTPTKLFEALLKSNRVIFTPLKGGQGDSNSLRRLHKPSCCHYTMATMKLHRTIITYFHRKIQRWKLGTPSGVPPAGIEPASRP
jgi:site-specific DNA recombinase